MNTKVVWSTVNMFSINILYVDKKCRNLLFGYSYEIFLETKTYSVRDLSDLVTLFFMMNNNILF